jgi:hypothetical protein
MITNGGIARNSQWFTESRPLNGRTDPVGSAEVSREQPKLERVRLPVATNDHRGIGHFPLTTKRSNPRRATVFQAHKEYRCRRE